VFAFLSDGENDKKFSTRIIEINNTTPGQHGVGTVYVSKAKDLGLTLTHKFEITAFEPTTLIRWKEIPSGPAWVAEGGYDLKAVGAETELTFFNEVAGRGPGKLLARLAARGGAKSADAFLASLKAAIEAS
jgi:hypothetical protein